MRTMNRRRFLTVTPLAVLGAVALPAVVRATTPGTSPGGMALPSDPSTPVLRLTIAGGFVPMGWDFSAPPQLLITAGGDVFAPGAMTMEYPGKLVQPITHRTLTPLGLQRVLTLAKDAKLFEPPPDYSVDQPMVTDMPYTTVEVLGPSGPVTHSAYALGFPTEPPSAPESTAPVRESTADRQRLMEFVAAITDLATASGGEVSDETLFAPTRYRLLARPTDPANVGSPDLPATIVDWPADAGVALATADPCAEADAAKVGTALADATSLTLFRDAGAVYQVWARGVLPGDAACGS